MIGLRIKTLLETCDKLEIDIVVIDSTTKEIVGKTISSYFVDELEIPTNEPIDNERYRRFEKRRKK